MTYVVTESCIRTKYMDCITVCPVDCFYEGENMLVINPLECIDCGACVAACKAHAIVKVPKDAAAANSALDEWVRINAEYALKWPNITEKGVTPADADAHRDEERKRERYFSPNPGRGG